VAHHTKHHPSSSHPSPRTTKHHSKFISLGIETLKAISPVTRIESIVFSMPFLPKHDAVVIAIVQAIVSRHRSFAVWMEGVSFCGPFGFDKRGQFDVQSARQFVVVSFLFGGRAINPWCHCPTRKMDMMERWNFRRSGIGAEKRGERLPGL
jgi:hypothetical protein